MTEVVAALAAGSLQPPGTQASSLCAQRTFLSAAPISGFQTRWANRLKISCYYLETNVMSDKVPNVFRILLLAQSSGRRNTANKSNLL